MARSKITYTCQTCANPFIGWTGKNRNAFCSQKCYHAQDRARAIVRFWARVEKTKTCWLWTGFQDQYGHGKSGIGPAHQIAWECTHGPIPDNLQVLHKCNNPPCVRPDHLYLGTPADNMKDRQECGHYDRGEDHPMAVVTEAIVREIRDAYIPRRNGGLTAIARRFNIAPSTVHAIVSRKIWKHI